MRELFDADPGRFRQFSLEAGKLFLDFSKNRITTETLELLLGLADERDLSNAISRLLRGDTVNFTEDRPALHTALRARGQKTLDVDGHNVLPDVQKSLMQMAILVDEISTGKRRGITGKRYTDAISIGVGGSNMGPALATSALIRQRPRLLDMHFVSNLDPHALLQLFDKLDPETTMVLVASKSFTTVETVTNAHAVRNWFKAAGIADASAHFFAITANPKAAIDSGIMAENTFEFWNWVGGRFSLWSAIGLPVALALGMDIFDELLDGAQSMDEIFRTAPLAENPSVILALLSIWYGNFFGCQTHAVVAYDERLQLLPSYLQQLEMESNGKSVASDGKAVSGTTAPVIWGGIGTDSQHAFFQLLHHGTHLIPIDFLVPLKREHDIAGHHQALVANAFGQARALMWGQSLEELEDGGEANAFATHRVFAGNRPSNTIVYDELNALTLGALVALYEHKVFVQGVLWNINPFDQWGVELGKDMARTISGTLEKADGEHTQDSSTTGLIARYASRNPPRI